MTWKIDLRSHDGSDTGQITERSETADVAIAEAAYRALLGREDLIGQPIAARLVSPISRKSIYFSRFDRDIGEGRIHPGAPLDLMAARDMTAVATRWRPPVLPLHDWEADPRPWAKVIHAWGLSLNGGRVHGARDRVAEELRSPRDTVDSWYSGKRVPPGEAALRRLMTLIDGQSPGSRNDGLER